MTYFDCFDWIKKLEIHVCDVKTSTKQYFLGDTTWFQVSLFKFFFRFRDNSINNGLSTFPLNNLKDN